MQSKKNKEDEIQQRRDAIVLLLDKSYTPSEAVRMIAEKCRLSQRQVWRDLKAVQDERNQQFSEAPPEDLLNQLYYKQMHIHRLAMQQKPPNFQAANSALESCRSITQQLGALRKNSHGSQTQDYSTNLLNGLTKLSESLTTESETSDSI